MLCGRVHREIQNYVSTNTSCHTFVANKTHSNSVIQLGSDISFLYFCLQLYFPCWMSFVQISPRLLFFLLLCPIPRGLILHHSLLKILESKLLQEKGLHLQSKCKFMMVALRPWTFSVVPHVAASLHWMNESCHLSSHHDYSVRWAFGSLDFTWHFWYILARSISWF